ncbi:MAG: transglycosylase SLT domain-containing protein [Saprospiraceae bacterium]|nr:transglycosylase SLT domain-containing protein [Saprospiraceae bacterium]
MATLLDRFRSISRPSLTSGSGVFSSLAKKQASAEDLMVDNLYAEGNISVEAYISHLEKRLTRAWNTPRTQVSIKEKMESANEEIVDAEVSRAHQAGEISTRARYEYELSKLENMKEKGSTAYINQQRLVSSLKDQAERQERSAFRIEQLNQLSQMPEDSSEKLWQKASIYDTLAQQARLDGDEQQAISLSTQANNYQASAKRAEINDFITQARLQVSETPTAGRGVPNSDEGATLYQQLTGTQAPSFDNEGGSGGSLTGFSGVSSDVSSSALTRLDRQQQTLERLYGQREDKMVLIDAYQQAVAAAEGDQKTSLTIALNNLQDDIAGIDNSIANTTVSIEDTIGDIQAARAKAAASAFNQERRIIERDFSKTEDELEQDFRDGKITKNEYVAKGLMLAQAKTGFFDQASQLYNNFGNDSSADSYLEKAEDMVRIHESLIGVAQNIEDYEPLFIDSESPLTNLLGQRQSKGDVVLTDVGNMKRAGQFDENYALIDGVWHKVYYPASIEVDGKEIQVTDKDGFLIDSPVIKDYARKQGLGYINKLDDTGKLSQERVKFLQSQDESGNIISRPYAESTVNEMLQNQILEQTPEGEIVQRKPFKADDLIGLKLEAKVQEKLEKSVPVLKNLREQFEAATEVYGDQTPIQRVININKDLFSNIGNVSRSINNFIAPQTKPFVEAATKFGGNLLDTIKRGASNLFGGIKLPGIVPEAKAAELTGGKYSDVLNSVFGGEADDAMRVLQGENAPLDPRAVNINTNGSEDRGLFQINSDTFADFQRRKGNQMRKAGITSYDDMFDPVKNAKMAAIIKDEQGWKAWYGAPDDLRAGKSKSLGNRIKDLFGGNTPVAQAAPDLETRNLELALGLKPGDWEAGIRPNQDRIDKAFRSNDQTRELLRKHGFESSQQTEPSPSSSSRTVGFTPPAPPSNNQQQQQAPNQVQTIGDLFRPKLLSPTPEAPRPDFTTLARNTLSNIGNSFSSSFQKTTGQPLERFNVVKQAQAVPDYLRQVVAPKIKSTVSNIFSKLNPFD